MWQRRVGTLTFDADRRRDADTPFDLASLTKVIATTTVVMELVDDGRAALDEPCRAFFAEWRGADRDAVTVRDLLEHASGLPARLLDAAAGRAGASSSTTSARCRSSTRRARDRSTAISGSSCSDSSPADRGGAPLAEQFDAIVVRLTPTPRRAGSVVRSGGPSDVRSAAGLRASRRTDAADGRGRAPRARAASARSTTTTPRRSAASPGTPACSARRRRSARSRARCCAPRAATRRCRRRSRPSWSRRSPTKTHGARQLARARLGYDAADFVVRHADVAARRSATSASPARRCGSIRRAIATSCC